MLAGTYCLNAETRLSPILFRPTNRETQTPCAYFARGYPRNIIAIPIFKRAITHENFRGRFLMMRKCDSDSIFDNIID